MGEAEGSGIYFDREDEGGVGLGCGCCSQPGLCSDTLLLLDRPKRTILCDSPNADEGAKGVEDEEYEPQWQEDYDDDDDLDEDNFLFDDESDNLDCDSYFDDDDAYD